MDSRQFELGHRPGLDGLRGLAVLAVMAVHTKPVVAPGGFLGVDLFFVLSGFLITALLVQEHRRSGTIHLGHFYLRRALRLLPALVALLAVAWLYALVVGNSAELRQVRRDSVTALLYVHNWRIVVTPSTRLTPHLVHVWSLAIEEQFYLVWPAALALLLGLRVRRRWVVGLILVACVVPSLRRLALWEGPPSLERVYFGTDTRGDALSAGCLVGLLVSWWAGPRGRLGRAALRGGAWLAVGVLLVHLFAVGHFDTYLYYGGFLAVHLSAALLIAALNWAPPPLLARLLEARPLCWLGRISYGVYLWNYAVSCFVLSPLPLVQRHRWAGTPLIWGATLLLGALSHYLVERPFLRLKQRLTPAETSLRPSRTPAPGNFLSLSPSIR
jgi:peptidoglycan/LPS O-acetylase OafA/YrhL